MLKDIVDATQKNWLRNIDTERWEIEENYDQKTSDQLLLLFKEMSLLDEYVPQKKEYDYIIFMGDLVEDMELRCEYLKKLLEAGYAAKQLVILAGERPLDEKVGEYTAIKKMCQENEVVKTEFDAIKIIICYFGFDKIFKAIAWVNAPMKKNETTGAYMRPTTDDTIVEWLKDDISAGSGLVISNQPYGPRQTLVVESLLPKEFEIACASCAVDIQEINATIILDELARYIYQYHKNSIKN